MKYRVVRKKTEVEKFLDGMYLTNTNKEMIKHGKWMVNFGIKLELWVKFLNLYFPDIENRRGKISKFLNKQIKKLVEEKNYEK